MATKRTWTVDPFGDFVCYKSEINDCTFIDKLVTVTEPTPSHDEELARATDEINAILRKVLEKRRLDKRHLCLLTTHKGPLLAWTFHGIDIDDDEEAFERALKLA